MLHLVPHTLVCTCCSKSMAAMQLSVPSFSVALLSHLWCYQSNRLDCSIHATGRGTHCCGFNSCRTRKVRRKVGYFVLIWGEFQASVWKKDPSHESKPWKIPTSKLPCFELPYTNDGGRQKNRQFITYYPLGYECSKLRNLNFFPLYNNRLTIERILNFTYILLKELKGYIQGWVF